MNNLALLHLEMHVLPVNKEWNSRWKYGNLQLEVFSNKYMYGD